MEQKPITVKDAIITVACGQLCDLLNDKFAEVTKDALKTFADTEDEGEPKCKIAFTVAWNPNSAVPKVESQLAWSVRRVAKTEDVADPNQIKLPLDADEAATVVTRDGRKVTPTAMLDEINAKFAAKIGGAA